VRTRTGSYAQQTMRILNVSGWTYGTGPSVEASAGRQSIYDRAMKTIGEAYSNLIEMGANIEDARGVLPTNIHTNIVASFNLRNLCEMTRKRGSSRTQGEYRDVLDAMVQRVKEAHPWADMFLSRDFDVAAKELEDELQGDPGISKERLARLIKLIDQMRGSV